jgi:hypothetical protein
VSAGINALEKNNIAEKGNLHGSERVVQKNSEKITLVAASTTNRQSVMLDVQSSSVESSKVVSQHCNSASGGDGDVVPNANGRLHIQNFKQQNNFHSRSTVSRLRAAVFQNRPRNLRGNRIGSIVPGTKPKPQWCPAGLTHTQKRRVQRLQAIEIKEKQKL